MRRLIERGLAGESKSLGPAQEPWRGRRASGLLWAARRLPERFTREGWFATARGWVLDRAPYGDGTTMQVDHRLA